MSLPPSIPRTGCSNPQHGKHDDHDSRDFLCVDDKLKTHAMCIVLANIVVAGDAFRGWSPHELGLLAERDHVVFAGV